MTVRERGRLVQQLVGEEVGPPTAEDGLQFMSPMTARERGRLTQHLVSTGPVSFTGVEIIRLIMRSMTAEEREERFCVHLKGADWCVCPRKVFEGLAEDLTARQRASGVRREKVERRNACIDKIIEMNKSLGLPTPTDEEIFKAVQDQGPELVRSGKGTIDPEWMMRAYRKSKKNPQE
jgi:hypothetical protein